VKEVCVVALRLRLDDQRVLVRRARIERAVARFKQELVLVSAGFGAHVDDPLAGMRVSQDGFRELARRCASLPPRIAAVIEGGYNLAMLPRLVDAALAGFSGSSS